MDGGIEIFDSVKGTSIIEKTENCRLCSITTLKLEQDMDEGNDMEFIFAGTSNHKITLI
jgi:hypothetical protein